VKKRHFVALSVIIVAAGAVGICYNSIMLSITGDCRYWHPNGSVDLSNAQTLEALPLDEEKCALKSHLIDLKRQNGAF
jgi:hypothetical protein